MSSDFPLSLDRDEYSEYSFTQRWQESNYHPRVIQTVDQIYRSHVLLVSSNRDTKFEAAGNLSYQWGGEDKPSFNYGFSAGAEDSKGNYVNGEFSRDSSGRNEVSLEAGHRSQDNPSNEPQDNKTRDHEKNK